MAIINFITWYSRGFHSISPVIFSCTVHSLGCASLSRHFILRCHTLPCQSLLSFFSCTHNHQTHTHTHTLKWMTFVEHLFISRSRIQSILNCIECVWSLAKGEEPNTRKQKFLPLCQLVGVNCVELSIDYLSTIRPSLKSYDIVRYLSYIFWNNFYPE